MMLVIMEKVHPEKIHKSGTTADGIRLANPASREE